MFSAIWKSSKLSNLRPKRSATNRQAEDVDYTLGRWSPGSRACVSVQRYEGKKSNANGM